MTYLELINEVMIMMREDEVATWNETAYSKLIGHFVNKAKHIVESSWTWHRLRTTVSITTVANTYAYTLTGAGKKFRLLERKDGKPDVLNNTEDTWLNAAPSQAWMTLMLNQNNNTPSSPEWFDFNGYDSNDDPIINLYPIPDGGDTILFNLFIPQAKLAADATKLVVPDEPVIELAYLFALEERGEDAGTVSDRIEQIKNGMLADAITFDAELANDELVWREV